MAKSTYDISFNGTWDANALLVVTCSTLAGYNALELLLLVFTTFNVYRGLYFWSLLVASSGIVIYLTGLNVVYFGSNLSVTGWVVSSIGWMCMVTGQSVVLYSRLGIVLGTGYDKTLGFVKWMIIVDAIILHSTTWVATFGSHFAPNPIPFQHAYFYIEKIQMTGFCLQEFVISGLYIWKTLDLIRTGERRHTHRIMAQLFAINLIIVILDVGLLSLEYKNLFVAEISFKELCYSIKLKLEFAILTKLVELTSSGRRRFSNFFGNMQDGCKEPGQSFSIPTMSRIDTTPTATSDSRPQWMLDMEKLDSVSKVQPEKAFVDHCETSAANPIAEEHTFQSERLSSAKTHRRSETDLMYAEAVKTISRF